MMWRRFTWKFLYYYSQVIIPRPWWLRCFFVWINFWSLRWTLLLKFRFTLTWGDDIGWCFAYKLYLSIYEMLSSFLPIVFFFPYFSLEWFRENFIKIGLCFWEDACFQRCPSIGLTILTQNRQLSKWMSGEIESEMNFICI